MISSALSTQSEQTHPRPVDSVLLQNRWVNKWGTAAVWVSIELLSVFTAPLSDRCHVNMWLFIVCPYQITITTWYRGVFVFHCRVSVSTNWTNLPAGTTLGVDLHSVSEPTRSEQMSSRGFNSSLCRDTVVWGERSSKLTFTGNTFQFKHGN